LTPAAPFNDGGGGIEGGPIGPSTDGFGHLHNGPNYLARLIGCTFVLN